MVSQRLDGAAAWAARTAPDIARTAAEPGSIVVVPLGSLEQHGPHLPTGTDAILAEAAAHAGADRVETQVPILVTPPVWTGYSPHHTSLGGTISLPFDVALEVLEAIGETALENGFDALCFVNGHGGNVPLMQAAVSEIGAAHGDREVVGVTYFDLAREAVERVRESNRGGMGHAGEFETSLILHLHPDLAREGHFERSIPEGTYPGEGLDLLDGAVVAVYRPFERYAENGTLGDPTVATAEKGERLIDGIADGLEALYNTVYGATTDAH